ncbi:putative ATPase [Vibrio crassostreae]|uniref:AAA family ATPase n=1 Tax=Vibrio crassostreae TaxID=246167 RepID=UPI000F4F8833|nr:DUF3696 domain-containing protein [Vibrio crassostreae]RPF11049.1 putative ATPase [Vibrio crassostreae]
MINKVELAGFKRFEKKIFDLKNLTLLTGMNGAGKSSFIQGLLLARESASSVDSVNLDDSYGVDLGTAIDVVNWNSAESIQIKLNDDVSWVLSVPNDNALYLDLEQRYSGELPTSFHDIPRSFTYLCAERSGPRSSYSLSAIPDAMLEVGVHGEHSTQLIEAYGNTLLPDKDRTHPLTEADETVFLTYQIEKWMGEIVRPISIRAEKVRGVKAVTLSFKAQGGDWVQATNMGFGVTYSLPIILAGLMAPKGGVLMIENPEAHLHPAGQSRMGAFLAWLAGQGVQVIVETHSDHLLNGVRRAIAEHHYIDSTDANVLFFDSSVEDGISTTLEFSDNGAVSNWPNSFFDQYQLDTAALGRIRRSKLRSGIRN